MSNIENIDDISYITDGDKFVGVRDNRSGISISQEVNRVYIDNAFAKGMSENQAANLCIAWLALSKPDVLKEDGE